MIEVMISQEDMEDHSMEWLLCLLRSRGIPVRGHTRMYAPKSGTLVMKTHIASDFVKWVYIPPASA